MPSRRVFLLGSAAGVGLVLAGRPALANAGAIASRPLLTGPFPRTFVFRQGEVLAQFRDYASWQAPFTRFGGMCGKVLPEERTDTVTARNVAYFNRYKSENRDAVMLLHYNGRARRPEYRTSSWYAGDWLHFAGATLVGAVSASATSLVVDDARQFSAPTDDYGNVGADLVLTGRKPDGTPDWSVAEQLVVTAVDQAANRLTVQRGAYGSVAMSFPDGAYVARHVTRDPWSAQDTRLWCYNLATDAPRGPDGRNAAERVGAEMAADFAPGGQLYRFDGIELDVFIIPVTVAERPTVDGNGDGVADACRSGTTDTYLAGQQVLLQALRSALGPSRLILVDGGNGQRPTTAITAGIEEEGAATVDEPIAVRWSTLVDALQYWSTRGHRPMMSYPLAKSGAGVGDPPASPQVRLSLATAVVVGTTVSFWDEPAGTSLDGLRRPPDSGIFVNRFSVWDELTGGTLADPGWLGMPTGPAEWTAVAAPTLPVAANGSGAYTVTGHPGGDLVLVLDVLGAPLVGDRVPGLMTVTVGSGRGRTIARLFSEPRGRTVRVYATGLPAGQVPVLVSDSDGGTLRVRSIKAHAAPDVGLREFDHGAVFVNPSATAQQLDLTGRGPFVRLVATSGQDATTNDGSALGSSVTIPAGDALFVRRA